MVTDPGAIEVLWAKYLDWCSAQIADRFVQMSPDAIYGLAYEAGADAASDAEIEALGRRASHELAADVIERVAAGEPPVVPGVGAGDRSKPPAADGLPGADSSAASSYRALVARVTEALTERLELPTFEEWRVAYGAAPERYDAEMLGFWRERIESDGE